MSNAMHRLRSLGLALFAVLGLIGSMAVSAQANWLLEGAELTANESVVPKRHTVWGLEVGGTFNIEFLCTTTASSNLTLLSKSATAEGDVEMSGCKAFQKGVENSSCNPINQPIKFGLKILLILHNGEVYLLLEPKTKEGTAAVFKFGELCSLAPSKNLLGTSVDECGHLIEPGHTWVHLDCANGEARHYIRPASRLLFLSDGWFFGAKPAEETGITELELSGVNKGKTWGGTI